eukprot:g77395.t1
MSDFDYVSLEDGAPQGGQPSQAGRIVGLSSVLAILGLMFFPRHGHHPKEPQKPFYPRTGIDSVLVTRPRYSFMAPPTGSMGGGTGSGPSLGKGLADIGPERKARLEYMCEVLRQDLPTLFEKDVTYDIYTDDMIFRDPVNKFNGKFGYRVVWWTLRFHGKLFFTQLAFDLHDVHATDADTIMAFWTVRGRLLLPYRTQLFFHGNSTYKVNPDGYIYEHVDAWDRGAGALLRQFLPGQPDPKTMGSPGVWDGMLKATA